MVLLIVAAFPTASCADKSTQDQRVASLAEELHNKGWIVYSSRSGNGSWDLFLSRPDGSQRKNITNTKDYEEAAPGFSPDSKKMLYRRLEKGTTINHDKWGFQGRLVIANPDGTSPELFGHEGQFPWASWSPDSKQVVCLTKKEIQVLDLATKNITRTFPRHGIYQQLFWSPDGKWICGVSNKGGADWTIVRISIDTGEMNIVHKFQNCAPDWFPDSKHLIFSSRPANQPGNNGAGWTQLWMAEAQGKNQKLVFGEDGVHIYGGELSPDGKYVLFSKCPVDGGGSEKQGAPICIVRFADTPIITGKSSDLRKVHPDTKDGPVLPLNQQGWEPCWTYAEIGPSK